MNQLAGETSPYLLQHAKQPVHWQAWGEAAFNQAKKENKLVFLSIGYSTCHWCHVMAHDSFDDAEVAAVLNTYFVSIKVDREERPDVDATYMSYLQMTTGQGGWPMSVWLTPEAEPIVGGTYFPKENQEGRTGFTSICQELAALWLENPQKLARSARQALEQMQKTADQEQQQTQTTTAEKNTSSPALKHLINTTNQQFDQTLGGFGNAPKFPRTSLLNCLLYIAKEQVDVVKNAENVENAGKIKNQVSQTLEKMAHGGIQDQLQGGFHRYAVDAYWHIPHYEKMLYDQALLLSTYAKAYTLEQQKIYQETQQGIINYLQEEMLDANGLYHAAEDADSMDEDGKNKEGAYWTWTEKQLYAALPDPRRAAIVAAAYGIKQEGNAKPESDPHQELTNRNTLYKASDLTTLSMQFSLSVETLKNELNKGKNQLLEARKKRKKPHKDDKIICAWNAYLITGMAHSALYGGMEEHKKFAVKTLKNLKQQLWDGARLYRTMRGNQYGSLGFAQDYAAVIQACLAVCSIHPTPKKEQHTPTEQSEGENWLEWAETLQAILDQQYWSEQRKGYQLSLNLGDKELFSFIEDYDGAEPSVIALSLSNLSTLALLTGKKSYNDRFTSIAKAMQPRAETNPYAMPAIVEILEMHAKGRRVWHLGKNAPKAKDLLKDLRLSDVVFRTNEQESTLCTDQHCQKI